MKPGLVAALAGALLAPLVSGCGTRAPVYDFSSDLHAVMEGKATVAANLRLILSPKCARGQLRGPTTADEILDYSRRAGVPMEEIDKTLIQFVEDGMEERRPESLRHQFCCSSMGVLADLHRLSALSLLMEASRSRNENLRWTAIRATVRMLGKDSVEFARGIVEDRRAFHGYDRFLLYEALQRHALESSAVRRFLVEAVSKETYGGCATLLDETLCVINEKYRLSIQRENILKRFEKSKVLPWRVYFSGELEKLLEVPEEKRTDLDKVRGGPGGMLETLMHCRRTHVSAASARANAKMRTPAVLAPGRESSAPCLRGEPPPQTSHGTSTLAR